MEIVVNKVDDYDASNHNQLTMKKVLAIIAYVTLRANANQC